MTAPVAPEVEPSTRRLLRTEMAIVLLLSLGQSAVYALPWIIEKLTTFTINLFSNIPLMIR